MRFVQRGITLFLRPAKVVVAIFIISLGFLAIFTPRVGATPAVSSQSHAVKTTMDFMLSWPLSADATDYQVRVSRDKALLSDNQASVWYSPWLKENELSFTSIAGAEDGEWFWQVRSRGIASDVGVWSEVWQVEVDTKAPIISFVKPETIVQGLGTSRWVDLQVVVDDTCTEDRCRVMLDGVDITQQLQVASPDNTIFTGAISIDALADGEHVFSVAAADPYGNKTEQTKMFTVDNTAPFVETSIEEGRRVRGITSLDFLFRDARPGTYRLDIVRGGIRLSADEAGLSEVFEKGQGVFSYSWDTTKLAKGMYHLIFTGVDEAGNKSKLTRTVEVVPSFLTLMGTEPVDPQLEQLTKHLSQPFISSAMADVVTMGSESAARAASSRIIRSPR